MTATGGAPSVQSSLVDHYLAALPQSFGDIQRWFSGIGDHNPLIFRQAVMRQIESETQRPLLCYVTQTTNAPAGASVSISNDDLLGFSDLVNAVDGEKADVFVVSDGGSAEATERIVRLLRTRFSGLRFFVPFNAYSAATLMCMAGDEILMLPEGTFGPIDPQLGGVPIRAILRGFDELERRLSEEGPSAITAYVPLLQKYDLHLLERCRSAEELARELAREWLGEYAMKNAGAAKVDEAVDFFGSWDLHKSHARSIDAEAARRVGIPAKDLDGRLAALVRNLCHQYTLFFELTTLYKAFETKTIAWGRQYAPIVSNAPP